MPGSSQPSGFAASNNARKTAGRLARHSAGAFPNRERARWVTAVDPKPTWDAPHGMTKQRLIALALLVGIFVVITIAYAKAQAGPQPHRQGRIGLPTNPASWARATARLQGSTLVVTARLAGPGRVVVTLLKPASGIVGKASAVELERTSRTVMFRLPSPQNFLNLDLFRLRVEFQPRRAGTGVGRRARTAPAGKTETLIVPLSRILEVPLVEIQGQRSLVLGSLSALRILVTSPSHRPVANARVQVRISSKAGRNVWAEGRTDVFGLAQIALTVPQNWRPGPGRLLVTAWSSGIRRRIAFSTKILPRAQVLLDLDKPVYQPGQTMHFRVLALSEPSRFPLGRAKVVLSVRDPRANLVFEKNLRTDEFGVAAADLPLASGILTGPYEVSIRLQDADMEGAEPTMTKTVKVYAYRPPILAVETKLDRRFYRPGDKAVLEVRAHHMWGSKVQSGKVLVASMATCTAPNGSALTVSQREFRGNFDAQGLFRITVPIPKIRSVCGARATRGSMTLVVRVTAKGGFVAKKQITSPISKQGILLQAIPEAGRLIPGLTQKVRLLASTPDGRPVKGSLWVTLRGGKLVGGTVIHGSSAHKTTGSGRSASRPRVARPRTATARLPHRRKAGWFSRLRVHTNQQGVAKVTIRPDRDAATPLLLRLDASDRQGNRGMVRIALPFWKDRKLLVRSSCSLCRAGDKVRLQVFGPARLSGPVYLELGAWQQTVQTLSATFRNGRAQVWTRLPKSAGGAMRLTASLPQGSSRSQEGESLLFVQSPYRLRVRLTWDKPVHVPGRKAALDIQVTDELGRPSQAALGLAVIDQAIYSMTGTRPQSGLGRFLIEEKAAKQSASAAGITAQALLTGPLGPDSQGLARALAGRLLAKGYLAFIHDFRHGFSEEKSRYQSSLRRRLTKALRPWAEQRNKLVAQALKKFWKQHYKHTRLCKGALPSIPDLPPLVHKGFLPAGADKDPWGHVLSLDRMSEGACCPHLPRSRILFFQLSSLGPDGVRGTEDDLVFPAFKVSASGLRQSRHCGIGCGCLGAMGAGYGGGGGRPVLVFAGHANLGRGFTDSPRLVARKRMAETLVWRPMLRTNEQGHLHLPFDLADNITTWTARVTASDLSGRLGFAVARTRSLKPLFLNTNLPGRLTRKDRINLPLVVHNETNQPRQVVVGLKRAHWFSAHTTSRSVLVPAHGAKEVVFPIRVTGLGPQKLTAMVRGAGLSDALQSTTLVAPRGRPVLLAASGTLSKDMARSLFLPPNAVKGTKKVTVTLESGLSDTVRESLSGLLQEPCGCFEQNASITYPNILVHRLLGSRRDALWKKAHRFVQAGYQRMLSYEVSGGGFSLFGAKPASIFLTALGLQMMADMKGLVSLDPNVIRRSLNFLWNKQEGDGSFRHDPALTAYVAWATARHRSSSILRGALRYLARHERAIEAQGPYAMALAGHAFAAAGRANRGTGARLIAKLAAMAKQDDQGARFWTIAGPQPKSGAHHRTRRGRIPTGGEGIFTLSGASGRSAKVEVTALATALLTHRTNRIRLARRAIEFLIKNRDSRGAWYSTQATVLALQALASGKRFLGRSGRGRVQVLWDGRPAGTITLGNGNRSDAMASSLTLDSKLLTQGRHSIRLVPPKNSRVLFRIALSYRVDQRQPQKMRHPHLAMAALGQGASPQSSAPPPVAGLTDPVAQAKAHPEGPILSATLKYDRGSASRPLRKFRAARLEVHMKNLSSFSSRSPMATLRLAPGMEPLRSDLDKLVRRRLVRRYEVYPGRVVLYLPPLAPKRDLFLDFRLIPTLTGVMSTGLSRIYDYYYPEGRTTIPSQTLTIR